MNPLDPGETVLSIRAPESERALAVRFPVWTLLEKVEVPAPETVNTPVNSPFPATDRSSVGVEEPRPNLPVWRRVRSCASVDDETTNGLVPPVPFTERVAIGVELPIPKFPF